VPFVLRRGVPITVTLHNLHPGVNRVTVIFQPIPLP
jgi:hypothetical protein